MARRLWCLAVLVDVAMARLVWRGRRPTAHVRRREIDHSPSSLGATVADEQLALRTPGMKCGDLLGSSSQTRSNTSGVWGETTSLPSRRRIRVQAIYGEGSPRTGFAAGGGGAPQGSSRKT
jgi:hypothetical protein